MIQYDLEFLIKHPAPVQIFTDKSLIYTSKIRLMIDISATREAYDWEEIADTRLIGSEYNISDCFMKLMFPRQLIQILTTGSTKHPIK